MNVKTNEERQSIYEAPRVEYCELSKPISVLTKLSTDALFEDLEDAGEY